MANSFITAMNDRQNYGLTENGALKHLSTGYKVYDLFALGGAYRTRSDKDVITLFSNALEEDELYALKCLFYLRDVRGGQGERRFFRVVYKWLCQNHLDIALRNIELLPEYGRWDDLIYSCVDTPAQTVALGIIQKQLNLDIQCKTPSLLAKWLPSENTSSKKTRALANIVRTYLRLDHRQYRKILSELRKRINIVERLMSTGQWDKIEFDKIPSKAGLIYKNAFARRDILKEQYRNFIKNKDTKVNANTLYPYEIVEKANRVWYRSLDDTDRLAINKYWENLPDYFKGSDYSILPVVDTSGSMYGRPLDVACSLGIYAGERNHGPFHNHYISFSSRPQLISIEGADLVDKVNRIYRANLCENTDLEAVFDMLLNMLLRKQAKVEDLPKALVVISDMEIDVGTGIWGRSKGWTTDSAKTEMERIHKKWAAAGYKLPKLVYWNVDARHDTILDSGPNVSFCSGCSPILFQQIITGKSGLDLMLDKLNSDRYKAIQ